MAEVVRVGVPVVSIGNLTVGGTGKTPMVEWLCRRLRGEGIRTAILSRGYRAGEDGRNDEALELELALPDVPHLQNADRGASATIAVEELASQCLVLDDGFQHRRLARDLDVVLLDASQPFGFEHLLPRGLLREPPSALVRAHVVVLSRADMIDAEGRAALRRRVAGLAPAAAWCEVVHEPTALINAQGARRPLGELASQRIAAFCGIGNPAGFRHTLTAAAHELAAWREFSDHHAYSREDVEHLAAWARGCGALRVVCTRKDLVKLRTNALGGVPLAAIEVQLRFDAGEEELAARIAPLVARARDVEML